MDWEYALCLLVKLAASHITRLQAAKEHDATVKFPTAVPMLQMAYGAGDMDAWTRHVVQIILTSTHRLQIQSYPGQVGSEAMEKMAAALAILHAKGFWHIILDEEELDANSRRKRVHVLL